MIKKIFGLVIIINRVMLTGAPDALVKEVKRENFKLKITLFLLLRH